VCRPILYGLIALIPIVGLFYALTLGVYAVASTRPRFESSPASPAQADVLIEQLGLREAYPFRHRFLDVPGGRMHYLDEGAGRVLLCLHGNPTWSFLYRELPRNLQGEARVVAPDLIGFGLSEKPSEVADYTAERHVADVLALVRKLDLRDVTLVVQDWGAPIGLALAAREPQRIRALVVMNTFALAPEGVAAGDLPLALRLLRLPLLGEQLQQGFAVFQRAGVPAAISRDESRTELVLRAYREVQGDWDTRAGALAFPRLIPTTPDHPSAATFREARSFVESFRGPALIVWGTRDPVFGAEALESWRALLPEAEVVALEGAGHFPQEDAPQELVAALRALR